MKSGLKNLISKAKHSPEETIPTGTLNEEQLNLRVSAHHGLPRTASILAFDPIQRLLAVASLNGCIKVFGAAGVEALFKSPRQEACKFLHFTTCGQLVHITADNDIEVWDLEKQDLACTRKWESKISACAIIPGTPFMYIGDDFGNVSVVEFNKQQRQLTQLPYGIPVHVTLGGIVRAGSSSAPSVVSILPEPDAIYSRLIIAYANGLLILWALHENKVLAVRGGTKKQHELLKNNVATLEESAGTKVVAEQATFGDCPLSPKGNILKELDEEEKEICTLCWASGNTVIVGYMDGDVWIWSFPSIMKEKNEARSPFTSGAPLRKLDLAPGKPARMPVILLKWCTSSKVSKGGSGRLYVIGGSEVGSPEVLTVVSLDGDGRDKKLLRLELLLHGPCADMSLVPSPGGTHMAALLVLTSPGQLHLYDEVGIGSCFSTQHERSPSSCLQSVAWPSPVPDTTAMRLLLLPQGSGMATTLLQLFQDSKDVVPPSLPAGTSWPVTGGKVKSPSSSSRQSLLLQRVLLTAIKGGDVQLWDNSTPTLQLVHTIKKQSKTNATSVSVIDICPISEYLALGHELGEVLIYKLGAESRELTCHLITSIDNPQGTDSRLKASLGFQCVVVSSVHQAEILSLSIASTLQRLAAGDATGMISILDMTTWTLLYLGNVFEAGVNSGISSLAFATAWIPDEGIPPSPPSSPFGSKKRPSTPSSPTSVIYAVSNEGSLVVVEGGVGRGILSPGAVSLKHSSMTVSMYLLDAYGAPLATTSNNATKEVAVDQPFSRGPGSEAIYVLLCLEDSVRLYSTNSVIQTCDDFRLPLDELDGPPSVVTLTLQGVRKTLRKSKLQAQCLQAFPFASFSTHACGLFLLYSTGTVEIRSLPDLAVVKESTLSSLNHKLEPSSLRTFTWTSNGQIAMIQGDSELVQLSSLAEENDMRLPDSTPLLFVRDLATACEAGVDAPIHGSRKKMQNMIGGVMREIKSAIEQPLAVHSSHELTRVFSSRPFTIPSANGHSKGSTDSSSYLEIDDIEIDELGENSPRTTMSKKDKLVSKLKRGFKGSINVPSLGWPEQLMLMEDHSEDSNSSPFELSHEQYSRLGQGRKEKNNESDSRAQLFDDIQEDKSPRVRSADSIKAAYGHKPSGDPSSIAAMSRDKLIERQEKLQAINKNTEEMQEGAGNFASLAEQLAKKIENRKWYEF